MFPIIMRFDLSNRRRKGDGLRGFFWPRQKYEDVEMDAVQQALLSRSKT